jgi:hypothetical protein
MAVSDDTVPFDVVDQAARRRREKASEAWTVTDQGDLKLSCSDMVYACQPSSVARIAAHHLAAASVTSPMFTAIASSSSTGIPPLHFASLLVYSSTVDPPISSTQRAERI